MAGAYFGQPVEGFVPGGTHVTVYLIPVFEGRLVAFDVAAQEARGRWLPWDVLNWGANPYEAASALADDWCEGALSDLRIVDVMSFGVAGEGWELATIFRAELADRPTGDSVRTPHIYGPGEYDAIGNFDPVDLARWVEATPPGGGASNANKLVF